MKFLQLAGAGLLINFATLQFAAAAEWRFCVASSGQEHRIYLTAPFLTASSMEAMEKGFRQVIEHSGRRLDGVQCPTGPNEQAVRLMRQHADDFNRQMGNDVVPLDWKPDARR